MKYLFLLALLLASCTPKAAPPVFSIVTHDMTLTDSGASETVVLQYPECIVPSAEKRSVRIERAAGGSKATPPSLLGSIFNVAAAIVNLLGGIE